jgi:uracil phosphoribosyltransferase
MQGSIGQEMARHVIQEFFLEPLEVKTPMGEIVHGHVSAFPMTVIISKREERTYFAAGMQDRLENSTRGYVDFGGRRGPEVLKYGPTGIDLPDLANKVVDTVCVSKTAIAGGCTVVEMARLAVEEYAPSRIVFVSAFYTNQGIEEIADRYRKAFFVVAGDADSLDANRMLLPGIGQLQARLQGARETG